MSRAPWEPRIPPRRSGQVTDLWCASPPCEYHTRSLDEIEKNIDENTKCVYYETISNPSYLVPKFDEISAICKKHELPLIVDNTFGMCG